MRSDGDASAAAQTLGAFVTYTRGGCRLAGVSIVSSASGRSQQGRGGGRYLHTLALAEGQTFVRVLS